VSIRVLIIDDHAQYREWLGHHITAEWPDAEVQGVDPAGESLLPEDRPVAYWDVVILDYAWDGGSGLDVLSGFKAQAGFPPVILMTAQGDEAMAEAAIRGGADDFMPKSRLDHEEIVRTLREAMRRGRRTGAKLVRTAPRDAGDRTAFELRGHRFVRHLGHGGTTSVYLMENEQTGKPIVVKVLRQVPDISDGERTFERFLQEYEMVSTIRHPNVVDILDLGVADDHAYIAMEYFPRGDLGERIREGLSPDEALAYLEQMARALAAIHALGVLHRDLKPANVMVRLDDTLALIDFGLAKQLQFTVNLTHTGEIFGSPYYMSPEQGHGEPVDARSDIYGLGMIFYEMLTGQKAFVGSSPITIIYKHAHAPMPPLPPGMKSCQLLLDMMVAKRPRDRYQTAEALLEDVREARGEGASA
jgi:DNA-binding response OmpR family regulator